jgi:hypothetical protein
MQTSHTDLSVQPDGDNCPTCGNPKSNDVRATAPSYVYALGRIEARFPSLGVEKEFAQAVSRADTRGQSQAMVFKTTLSESQNRYLARQLSWVFTVTGMETYILVPRDPMDLNLLIDAIRPEPSPLDIDIVVGIRGPIANSELYGGLQLPMVAVDQLYSFPRDELIKAIPLPTELKDLLAQQPNKKKSEIDTELQERIEQLTRQFERSANELFDIIIHLTDNAGATDEHRALNYLAVRNPWIYEQTYRAYAEENSLSGVEVRPSRLIGVRKIMDVIFSYVHRKTGVLQKYFVSVDVTEQFPFMTTPLTIYYDH